MRIGILTSWRVPCGVFQYSSRMADALAAIGHEPVILAGRADEHRSVPEESEHEVHDVAQIGLWRDDQEYHLDQNAIREASVDVLHVQYQSMLFNYQSTPLEQVVREAPVSAITFHDNCNPPGFPYTAFDLHFTHRAQVGMGEVIPFGIEYRPPVVRTFGLGRSQLDIIRPICDRHGWIFESAASHEPIQGGGQAWRSHEDLIQWLRGADLIVLWYAENDMAGSSLAARDALAARRPLIVSHTTWFKDLPARMDGFVKAPGEASLEREMEAMLARPYVEENDWRTVAALLVERYTVAAEQRAWLS